MKQAFSLRKISPLFLFPAAFCYWELVLCAVRADGTVPGILHILMVSIGAGMLCAGVTGVFIGGSRRRVTTGLLTAFGLFFGTESLIRSIYTTYMSPTNLLSGAGGVAGGYTGEFLRSILYGMPKLLLFLLPLILYRGLFRLSEAKLKQERSSQESARSFQGDFELSESGDENTAVIGRQKNGGEKISEHKRKKSETEEREIEAAAGVLMVGILLLCLSASVAAHGKDSAIYGAQFDYNQAVNRFGLTDATRLSLQYAIFGNKNTGFVLSDAEHAQEKQQKDAAGDDPAKDAEGLEIAGRAEEGDGARTETDAKPSLLANAAVTGEKVRAVVKTAVPGSAGEEGDAGSGTASGGLEIVYAPHEMEIDFSTAMESSEAAANLTEYVLSLSLSMENEYTGIFEGKNLILVCAESYCDAFINAELTPTLWRLSRNGFYFSEYYQPEWGGSTTTGEASFLLGLAPKDGDETMLRSKKNNNYFTMGNQLQRLGYSSIAVHGGDDSFYHRDETHVNLGYNQFIANRSGIKELCGHIYPTDTEMIEGTVDLYLDAQPFSVYYMTMSGHAPYNADSPFVKEFYEAVDAYYGDTYYPKTKYYICYQLELERAMTVLVEKLEEAGIADDTVIVLVGDHYPYGLGRGEAWKNDRDYINDLIKGDDTIPYEEDRNGLIIWSGALENDLASYAREISSPTFSLDILPTLSNLFGLLYDSRLLPGRDALSEEEAIVFWNNLSWVTEEGMYDARHGVYTPRDGYAEDPAYRARMDEIVRNKILLSRTVMETDYYGLLFGEDEVTQAGKILYNQE